ncbi:hypothetical protein JAAARDRAFT_59265 [Jaapia argillacea MUCL 33604]|uniref:Uncharacterized protein n=1 Tax=Jaapia argillacea MUCL 33604 TaxID=933084 RepID=A0A067PYM5_9AGAM|nr:hypothetical protein JAAARDRAFT_59265 [Jaapia argillacea MUCL 33604]
MDHPMDYYDMLMALDPPMEYAFKDSLLSQDLLLKIAVIAVGNDRQNAISLALVCRTMACWMRHSIWGTVSLSNVPQVRALQESYRMWKRDISTYVDNVWIASTSARRVGAGVGQVFYDQYDLKDSCKKVAWDILKARNVGRVAMDCTLFEAGWITTSSAQPKQVFLLRNARHPTTEKRIDFSLPFFKKVTHMIMEVAWDQINGSFPKRADKCMPRLTHLAAYVPAGVTCAWMEDTLSSILHRVPQLEMLVVCLDGGVGRCRKDNALERLFKLCRRMDGLRKQKIILMPYAKPMEREWEDTVNWRLTVWDRALMEEELKPWAPLMEEMKPNWQMLTGYGMDMAATAKGNRGCWFRGGDGDVEMRDDIDALFEKAYEAFGEA